MNINKIFNLFAALSVAALSFSCSLDSGGDGTPGKPGSGGNGGGYSLAISAGVGGETRAILEGNVYKWEPGDHVGLAITEAGVLLPLETGLDNLYMESTHTQNVAHTAFTGSLTSGQITALSSGGTFDYYSYFPYDAANDGLFPNFDFTISDNITLTPNVFSSKYAPMVATPLMGKKPIVFIDGMQDEVLTEELSLHFTYRHVMSYVAIELDYSTVPQTVTAIDITSRNGASLAGTFRFDMMDGSWVATSNASSTITVNIDGGLTVGSGDVIYLPVLPGTIVGNDAFVFTFHYSGSTDTLSKSVPGTTFVRGNIHRLRVAPPSEYTGGGTITVTRPGLYYIEVWGGNGGNSISAGKTGSGGSGGVKRGLFEFGINDQFNIVIGSKGENANSIMRPGSNPPANPQGGASAIGKGGYGGRGGTGNQDNRGGFYGAGGGGASGITVGGSVWLVAGGGGGGGGLPSNTGDFDSNTWNGISALGGEAGSDVQKNETPNPGKGTSTYSSEGAYGQDGQSWQFILANFGGGGGGGGGGGYQYGGFGGSGGDRSDRNGAGGANNKRGGGGAGGMNYIDTTKTAPNPGNISIVDNDRPSEITDGYVVITLLR